MTGPSFLRLHADGTLRHRIRVLREAQSPCRQCPRNCGADRLGGEVGACGTGRHPRVAAAFPHFGEERCLVGRGGSGTVFLEGCSLGCRFCQNRDVSRGAAGRECPPDALADLFLALQEAGCENLNLVTPTHVTADLVEALELAAGRGLRLPVVWNTSGYEAMPTLRALEGVVDVYLPDLKTLDAARAASWAGAADYPEVARAAIAEMRRQVGDLQLDPRGVASHGLLVRHLVMPGATDDARQVVAFLGTLGPGTVNVMDQYRPLGEADRLPGLDRRPTADEVRRVREAAIQAGLRLV